MTPALDSGRNTAVPGTVYFTGFMASGKSRIGSLTAAALGRSFFDTDQWIEKEAGKPVPRIFAEDGEEAFRAWEMQALRALSRESGAVIALGGGTLTRAEAMDFVKSHGTLVALHADPEVILERVKRKEGSRPLLAGLDDQGKREKIRALLAERAPLYAAAHLHFESSERMPHHVLTRRIVHAIKLREAEPLWVELGDRRYPIHIGEGLTGCIDAVAPAIDAGSENVLVTDQAVRTAQAAVADRMRQALGARLFQWRSGEQEKNLKSIGKLYTYLLRHQYGRKTCLFAFGGGVVGDMTGFAAATFLRGVDFVQIPTTLLSMVDSSVGGKTGVNHPLGKNLIGAFYQPKAVVADVSVLQTLPDAELKAGLAEVAKYAFIRDWGFLGRLEALASRLIAREPGALAEVIRTSCGIKAEVVGGDERETKEGGRAVLNYGHTFGHAFEVLAGYGRLPHGLAVALGMRCAARLALAQGRITETEAARHDALLDALGLPKSFPGKLDAEEAWTAMGRDKKTESGKRVFILPQGLGQVVPVRGVGKAEVEEALRAVQPEGKT